MTSYATYRELLAEAIGGYLRIDLKTRTPETVQIMRLVEEAARAMVSGAGIFTIGRGFYERLNEVFGERFVNELFGDTFELDVIDDFAEIVDDVRKMCEAGGHDRSQEEAEAVRPVRGVPVLQARDLGPPDLFRV